MVFKIITWKLNNVSRKVFELFINVIDKVSEHDFEEFLEAVFLIGDSQSRFEATLVIINVFSYHSQTSVI